MDSSVFWYKATGKKIRQNLVQKNMEIALNLYTFSLFNPF